MFTYQYFQKKLLSLINPTYLFCSFVLAFCPVCIFIVMATLGWVPLWIIPIFWILKAMFDVFLFVLFLYGFHVINIAYQTTTRIRPFKTIAKAFLIPGFMAGFIVFLGFLQSQPSSDEHIYTLFQLINLVFKTQSNLYMIVFSVLVFSGQWLGLHYLITTQASLSKAVERGYTLMRSQYTSIVLPFIIMCMLLISTLWFPVLSILLPALLPAISYATYETSFVGEKTS